MERNTKSFISILIICLLSVCSLLPLFSVTTSATSSYTDIDSYTPNGRVEFTFHTTPFLGNSLEEIPMSNAYLHFPATLTSGWDYTWTETSTSPSWNEDTGDIGIDEYLSLMIASRDADTLVQGERYTANCQYLNCILLPQSSNQMNFIQMDITLRDFYVFDNYFDFIASDVKQSIDFYLSSETRNGIYSSDKLGSAEYRCREVGVDALYTTYRNSSHFFTPVVPYIFDHDGQRLDFPLDSGVSSLRINELTNLPHFKEDKLYHFEYLTLSYFLDPRSFANGTFTFDTDICYTDVLDIDNIVVTLDSSNLHLPVKDLGSWLGKATTGFFSAEFIPGFSFGGLVVVVLSFALLIWFLKLFAGG